MGREIEFGAFTGPQKVEVHRRQLEEIKPNEILVNLKACNICTSDYGTWSGARSAQATVKSARPGARNTPPYPSAPGHENAGYIEEKGSQVGDALNVGDLVAFSHAYCGMCPDCLSGNTHDCRFGRRPQRTPDGYFGQFGYATYKNAAARSAVKFNPDITPPEAGFAEPVSTAIYGIKKLQIKPSQNLVVIGAGTMGLVNAQVARAFGARVIITEAMEKKLDRAKQLGFQDVIDISKTDPVEAVKELTGGRGADIAILAVGVSAANQQALDMVKTAGAKILFFAAGYPEPELNISSNVIHYRNIALIGTMGSNVAEYQEAADLISSRAIDVRPLLEANFPLSDIQKAFELAATPGTYRVTVNL